MTREALPAGTEIDRYLLKDVLSEDGRGISYLAVDTGSVSGSSKVLVREYFPRGISVRHGDVVGPRDRQEAQEEYGTGLAAFIGAAHALIALKTHTLVPALDIVQENETAYLVLEWPEGRTFSELASTDQPMSPGLLRSQLAILLPGLADLHAAGLLHAAISPDTLIRLDDGYPAIAGLTHVERFDGADINRTHLLVETPYAAPELSSRSTLAIGPASDVYSLSATCWFLLTGSPPPSAAVRLASIEAGRGDAIDATELELFVGDDRLLAESLMAGLALSADKRIGSASAFLEAINRRPARLPAAVTGALDYARAHKRVAAVSAVALLGLVAVEISGGSATVEEVPARSNGSNVLVVEMEVDPVEIDLPEANIAKPRILANAAWLLVDREDASSVRDFMDTYDDEPVMYAVASERLQLLDERAWAAALGEGTTDALDVYLSEFSAEMTPPGVHVQDAKDRIIAMTSAREFEIAEARRLLYALGYKTNSSRGETPGLTSAVIGFQESAGLATDGEITGELLEIMSEEVLRRDREAKQLAAAEQRAIEAEAERLEQAAVAELEAEVELVKPPIAEPKIIYETKVASSKIDNGERTSSKPKELPVRKIGEVFRDCSDCPQVVVVPAGSYTMGSSDSERGRAADEGPQHKVEISQDFAMGKFEVTVSQYEAFVSATGRAVPASCAAESSENDGNWVKKNSLNFRNPGFSQTPVHPATCVSWSDAKAYTKWLSDKTGFTYRLASETEWEYAARAGSGAAYPFGRTFRDGCKHTNGADRSAGAEREHWVTAKCRDGFETTAPAGSFPANRFGLHDMLGNVWEWTEDCYAPDYTGSPRSEDARRTSTCRSRVTRGGSWASGPDMLRSAARSADAANARYDMLGFRVVRELSNQ